VSRGDAVSGSDDEDDRPVLSNVRDAASSSVPADAAERMLGVVPEVSAPGRGPAVGAEYGRQDYQRPRVIRKMNHENGGFDCPGCASPDDTKGLRLGIGESGIKHVTWEMTCLRVDGDVFAAYTVSELSECSAFALEDQGRLTEPMVYTASDRYAPVSWADAFELVGYPVRRRIQC
jgi:anaerobic selenocysteine-containing dehydrogenase